MDICAKINMMTFILGVGEMKLTIKDRMDAAGITRYRMRQLLNCDYKTIDNMYKGKATQIRLDTLGELCRILDCTPNDILIEGDPDE